MTVWERVYGRCSHLNSELRFSERRIQQLKTTSPSFFLTAPTVFASAWPAPAKLLLSSSLSCIKVSQSLVLVATEGEMKLFVSEGNPHCVKVLAALEATGVDCDVQFVNHDGKQA